MAAIRNCCEWACLKLWHKYCYDPNELISMASTENLLSRPVREVIEARIHEKMYRQKQLFNRNGFNIAIFQDGSVKGVREAFHPNAVMELTTLGLGLGEVRILGLESNLYLAFHSDGYLYGERDNTTDNSVFKEKIHGNYLIYLSKKFSQRGWHVGINRTGLCLHQRTSWHPWGNKSIQFLARKPFASPHPLRLLQNRHGVTMVITPEGSVKGINDNSSSADSNRSAIFEFIPTVPVGSYKLRSVSTGFFLAMDVKGKLYGEPDRNNVETVFAEHAEGSQYFVYLSVRYAQYGWYIAAARSGKVYNGEKSWQPSKQKAIQFFRKLAFTKDPSMELTKKFENVLPPLTYIDEEDQDNVQIGLNGLRQPVTRVEKIKSVQ